MLLDKKKVSGKYKEFLKTEKAKLTALEQKVKEKQKQADLKNKAAFDDLVAKATKPIRKMPGIAMYVKKNCSKERPLATLTTEWTRMTEGERQPYIDMAEEAHAELLKSHVAKPKAPASAYAKFLQDNYPVGMAFDDASKQISAQWKQLSDEEKSKLKPALVEWQAFAAKKKEWLDERIKSYLAAQPTK